MQALGKVMDSIKGLEDELSSLRSQEKLLKRLVGREDDSQKVGPDPEPANKRAKTAEQ